MRKAVIRDRSSTEGSHANGVADGQTKCRDLEQWKKTGRGQWKVLKLALKELEDLGRKGFEIDGKGRRGEGRGEMLI